MLAFAVLLAAASAVSGTSLRVTSCGGEGLACDGTYDPIPGGGLNNKPVYARQGNPAEPGFFFTGSSWVLSFPTENVTMAAVSSHISQFPDAPPRTGWRPRAGGCCTPAVSYVAASVPASPPPPPPLAAAPPAVARMDVRGTLSGVASYDRVLTPLKLATLVSRRFRVAMNRITVRPDAGCQANFTLTGDGAWTDAILQSFRQGLRSSLEGGLITVAREGGAIALTISNTSRPWTLEPAIQAQCDVTPAGCYVQRSQMRLPFVAHLALPAGTAAGDLALNVVGPATAAEIATAKLARSARVEFAQGYWLSNSI